jgi:S1-C subfamily serine protease
MFWRMRFPAVALSAFLTAATVVGQAADTVPSERRTPLVRLIERSVEAVVSIRIPQQGGGGPERVGTGSIIHPSGYVLTNQHVVAGAVSGRVQTRDGTTRPFEVIAELAHEDLAVLRIAGQGPFPCLRLGRSHDLLLGEPVIAIGDAAALPFTVSRGIVSGLGRATHTEHAFLPSMVQTDAAINGGNSGGPLINAVGEQIGVVTSRRNDADNVAFAITADRVRTVFAELIAAEQRAGIWVGAELDPLAALAVVSGVTEGGPAQGAGLIVGDTITRIDGVPVHSAADVALSLLTRGPGDRLQCGISSSGGERAVTLVLGAAPLAPAVLLESPEPGLDWEVFEGAFDELPDFTTLRGTGQGSCEKPAADVHGDRSDDYALAFTGFVEVPTDGLWRFGSTSDDGSRVWVAGHLVVDNDGLHSAVGKTGLRRLAAGLHPIRIEFFERAGDEVLTLHWSGPKQPWGEVPASAYRRAAR